MKKKLDSVIIVSLPVLVTVGWCSLVWDDPSVSIENKDYRQHDPIAVDEPGLFLETKEETTKTPISAASSTENFQAAAPTSMPTAGKEKKPRPVTAADTGPTDWHDDPTLDDELIGSCGKRLCDCSDTFESCESDIDCCNGYDVCIKNKCERYEDY